ncbi:MAG: Ribonuclease Y [Phycisphaerae bacterium]|nr:Ribonuclease Y [Phycisphaerae bacterium]
MGPLALLLAVDFTGGLTGVLIGGGIAVGIMYWIQQSRKALLTREIDQLSAEAKLRAEQVLKTAEVEAKEKLLEMQAEFERQTSETRAELKESEKRILKREDNLDKKIDVLTTKERNLELSDKKLKEREKVLGQREGELEQTFAEQRQELLRISRLSADEARQLCLRRIEQEVEREAGQMVERIITTAKENADEKARQIVIQSIQRYAADHTCEATVSTVDVPSDEMKGRIIGREGRNIRSFERATGVDVIVDDTPGVVIVSCFDPIRREIARLSLERLVKDGRIHPTRIEDLVTEATEEVERKVAEAGKKAALDANVNGLNKKLVEMLGRLHFRTSYGQNVLKHSMEVAFLCQTMADELGLDGALARRCGLLHDIGKAMDHEVEGGHPHIGAEFCKRFNEPPQVINAVAGHHGDVEALYPYTPLVAAADAISAARPGGRRESLDRYIQRLEELEGLAGGFDGVKQAYAIQAGREVRVIVDALKVDDRSSVKLARDIANKIEETMTYPGEVKITVLREIRAVEFAK